MTLSLPSLDQELSKPLLEIVHNRKHDKYINSRWSEGVLPRILSRLDVIVEISKAGEQYGKRPKGVDLHSAIAEVKDTISQHLSETFQNSPPYTIVRLGELLLDPDREGYYLVNNVEILKYLNSLAKVVLVSSEIVDYPPITFLTELESTELIEPTLRETEVPDKSDGDHEPHNIETHKTEIEPHKEPQEPDEQLINNLVTNIEPPSNGLKRDHVSSESDNKRIKQKDE